jgi:hypothetical protein
MTRRIGLAVVLAWTGIHSPGMAQQPRQDVDPPLAVQTIVHMMPAVRSVPGVVAVSRDDMQIVSERLRPGQWKCTVYYRELFWIPRLGITFSLKRQCVIDIDTRAIARMVPRGALFI